MIKQNFSNIGSPVKDFISNFFEGLDEGLKSKGLVTCKEAEAHSKMELNVVATGETSKGGGVRVWGLGADIKGAKSNTSSQKITVFVKKPSEVEDEEEKARIEKAKEIQKRPYKAVFGDT
jgi:hypothetical protein